MTGSGAPNLKIGADIPYFFYDIIARITPGAFFVLGVLLVWDGPVFASYVRCLLDRTLSSELSVGVATLLFAIGLIAFVGISAFLGFLLASISNVVIEQWLFHRWPPSVQGLTKFLGVEDIENLKKRFQTQFGSKLRDDAINRASFLCSYYVWRIDANLGAMTGRLDAELLAAQSVFLVSLILALAVLAKGIVKEFDLYLAALLISFIVTVIAAWLAFKYHRKKRVYSRYALFLAVTNQQSQD